MARIVRNTKIDSRSARVKLAARREPYWVVISKGCALGYRKGAKGGTWIARYRDEVGKQQYHALSAADDAIDADDNDLCIDYAEAQRRASEWFKLASRGFEDKAQRGSSYKVRDALSDYLKAYERRGGKDVEGNRWSINALILPKLGDIQVVKLSRRKIEEWHEGLSKAPPRVRTKKGETQNSREVDKTAEGIRRRKSSANRVLTILKAALNHAYNSRKVTSDDAWRSVKPFREADAARIRYLNDAESKRLVNKCKPEFRPLVQAALLTGCRYGELTALTVRDFNQDAGTLHIRISKSGKPRHVYLGDEGREFFETIIHNKKPNDLLLSKSGTPWGTSHQQRPFKLACKAAKLGDLTFHELRHTYASRLVMSHAPLNVVAAQLGHSDTRMVEKHYGHLAPSYVADTVRSSFSSMGIVAKSNVVPMKPKKPGADKLRRAKKV